MNKPYDLRISLLQNNYSVDINQAVFSWKLPKEKDFFQTAYRLVFFCGETQILDTGYISSDNNLCVRLEEVNDKFLSNTLYRYKVYVKDLAQNEYVSNEKYFITTQEYTLSEKTAVWDKELSDMILLRAKINAEPNAKKTILRVSALSPEEARQYVYKLYVNEQFVGLGPTRLIEDNLFYNTYDITDIISAENVLSATCFTRGQKGFWATITQYEDNGQSKVIFSTEKNDMLAFNAVEAYGIDNEKSIGTPYYYAPAENINADISPFGFEKIDFDDTDFASSIKVDCIKSYSLKPYPGDNVLQYEIESEIVENGDTYFCDLGKEIIGGVKFCVTVENECYALIKFGEELNKEGSIVCPMRTGNKYELSFKLKKGENEISTFGMMAWRYCEVVVDTKVQKICVKGLMYHNGLDDSASEFNCSDEFLNELYKTMKYSIKATNQDLMVDSQSRERGAYEGDLLINAESSFVIDDRYSLSRFTAQFLDKRGTWPAEYPLFLILAAYNEYMNSGDDSHIKNDYERLCEIIDDVDYREVGKDLVLARSKVLGKATTGAVLVDWPCSELDGFDFDFVTYNTVFNTVCYLANSIMVIISKAIEENNNAKKYFQRAESIKNALNKLCYDGKLGSYCDGLNDELVKCNHSAQHSGAFGLACGVADTKLKEEIIANTITSDSKIKMSVYGSYFLLLGLYKSGFGDKAYDLLMNDDIRSYKHMINDLHSTISAEAWDPSIKPNMTFSHPWGSAALSVIAKGIFGIEINKPGYKEFTINPCPSKLKNAKIVIPTVLGEIKVSFESENGALTNVQCEIPSGAIARIPIESFGKNVTVDGSKNTESVIALSSGKHVLSV